MILPSTTFAGQKVTICSRYIELFRQEANSHASGLAVKSLRAELDDLMPEAYHGQRLVWLHVKWNDVLYGNDKLGFPGVDLDKRSAVTEKKNEAYLALSAFYKYQREEYKTTVKSLLHERHKAMEECRQDGVHNPALSDFKRVNGKLSLDLPSKNPMNESTNIAFTMRASELFSGVDDEHSSAVSEAIAAIHQKGYEGTFWDNKIDKELVRLNINRPAPPDPPEDFTTYTDDDPLGHTVITASTITGTGITLDETTLVYDDKTAGHFIGNFTHLIDTNVTNVAGGSACASWVLSNDVGEIVGLLAANKSFLRLQHNSGTDYILIEAYLGTQYTDSIGGLTDGQTYYNEPDRDVGIGSFGILTNEIFSDIDRITTVGILSVLLHADLDYRYVFALMSGDANSGSTCNIVVSNLDLQEAAVFQAAWARNSNQIIGMPQ